MISALLICLVVGISDGDTLTARCPTQDAAHPYEQIKVRIGAIDAPERRQPYGNRARQALAELVFQKEARLNCYKADRWKRQVCSVWVAPNSAPDGPKTLDAGLAMVTLGMAWWYRAYSKEQTPEARGQYEFAEQEAKSKRAGLWEDPRASPPWEWRKQAQKKTQEAG
ncbi:MAG: thermonuclease family protein [Ottowia sp.]|uniref:thermonuclease family protein n=1 Tax=Ottowia sp. TaxID=1898956 RepID=UPI003C76EDB8